MSNSTLDSVPSPTRQLPLRVDESRMTSVYANAIRTSSTNEEVVLDFGLSLPQASGGKQAAHVFTVDNRVVLNWASAKRLAASLAQMVHGYEQRNGEITAGATANLPS